MQMKLTDRDKKLLIVLIVVAIIGGLGVGVIRPLITKGGELSAQVEEAQLTRDENEQKIIALPSLQKNLETVNADIAELQQEFYPVMKSMQIDQLLTEQALAQGVTVKTLDISLPAQGEFAQVDGYSGTIGQTAETTDGGETTYTGMYSSKIQMSMEGGRDPLQNVLDNLAAEEPKIRVVTFSWSSSNNRENEGGTYTLNLSLELYMCEDMNQYIQEQEELAAEAELKAAAADAAAGDSAEDMLE